MVSVLPRIGLQLLLQPTFETVTWKGCGPHESYPVSQRTKYSIQLFIHLLIYSFDYLFVIGS